MSNNTTGDLATDAQPGKPFMYMDIVCLRDQREQHTNGNGQNEGSDDEEETDIKQFVESNNHNCVQERKQSTWSLPSSDPSGVVDDGAIPSQQFQEIMEGDKQKYETFFVDLKARKDWQAICVALGYPAKTFLNMPTDNKDTVFVKLLMAWYDLIVEFKLNGLQHMYRALQNFQVLPEKLLNIFCRKEPPEKPPISEVLLLEKNLMKINPNDFEVSSSAARLSNPQLQSTGRRVIDEEELFKLCKGIWDNLTTEDIREIKAFLHMTDKKNFGYGTLDKIKTGTDLMEVLMKRDLLRVDKLDFLKKIFNNIKRTDLENLVERYEVNGNVSCQRESYERGIIVIGHSNDTQDHLQKELELVKSKLQELNTNIANISERSKGQHKKIAENKNTKKHIATKKAQVETDSKNCQKEKQRIADEKKKLATLEKNNANLESSLSEKMVQVKKEEEEINKRFQMDKFEMDRLDSSFKEFTRQQRELQDTVQSLEKQMQKIKLANGELNNRKPGLKPSSDLDTDAQPTEPGNTVSRAYREQHSKDPRKHKDNDNRDQQSGEPSKNEDNAMAKPPGGELLIIAAEEDKEQESEFHADLQEFLKEKKNITCMEIIAGKTMTNQFLIETDETVSKAKIVFLLLSATFTKDYWPKICEMKCLTTALYDKDTKPRIVPVAIEKNTTFPMGLNSTHKLHFHRRDSYYKKSLEKLIAQEANA